MPTQADTKQAQERSAIGPHVVHAAIRKEGEEELRRPVSALAWSGLAAGLSMGFSLVAESLLASHLPDSQWRPLISKFGYSVGFLIVVLGRQQLFTENTLTVILPLLHRKNAATFFRVARLWATVLAANLAGAFLFAICLGKTDVFDSHMQQTFAEISRKAVEASFGITALRGVFAGWLIALMVWLLPAAETARVSIIIIITYLVGLAGLAHVIAGSVEVLYLVVTGALPWFGFLSRFLVPALIGNIIGGVSLVAALNHAQVVSGKELPSA